MPIVLMSTLGSVVNVRLFEIGGRPVTIASLTTSLTVVVATFLLSWLAQRGIHRALLRRGVDDVGTLHVASRLLHYAFLMIGFAIAFETAGIQLSALFTAGAVLAVGIGFGLQNITQNFVSGVILLVERSIKPGDVLELDGYLVRVVDMGIRATRVRTRDDEVLIVPNATLVQSTVKSYTLIDPHFRVRVKIGVSYGSDMTLVRQALERAAQETQKNQALPTPMVLLTDFNTSSVDWEIALWTDDPWAQRPVASQLRENVWRAFAERKIQMPFPQIDVHADEKLLHALARKAA